MDLNTDLSTAAVLGRISAVVAGIAAFLPWVTAGLEAGPLELNASSTGIEGLGLLTLLLAVAVVGIVLTLGIEEQGSVVTSIVGVGIGAIALWKILAISGAASPGNGLYLTILGDFGLLAAGIGGNQPQPQNRTR